MISGEFKRGEKYWEKVVPKMIVQKKNILKGSVSQNTYLRRKDLQT